MSRLFASLYLDEDVSVLIAKLLRSRGMVVETTVGLGQSGKSDADQLAFSAARQMALVTHNRGDFEKFGEEYRVAKRYHGGIIIAVRRLPQEIARRLLIIIDQYSAEEMDNQIFYI